MKQYLGFLACASALILTVLGCGGSGGGTSTDGSTSGGGSTFTLGGSLVVNGGQNTSSSAVAAGTHTVSLSDQQSHTTSFANMYLPFPLEGFQGCTIIRAGSKLFAGTYSGADAVWINGVGNEVSMTLASNGALTKDVALPFGTSVRLPVTANGGLNFSGGVRVAIDASVIGNNTQDVTLTLTSSATNVPTAGNTKDVNGSLSFSGGSTTANTFATVDVTCVNSAGTEGLSFSGGTPAPSKTVEITGQVKGSSFTSNHVDYSVGL